MKVNDVGFLLLSGKTYSSQWSRANIGMEFTAGGYAYHTLTQYPVLWII